MRLIDADAMHKFVEDKVAEGKDGWANGVGYEWAWTLTAVDMQPTIDAVEVVRCKDCKWYQEGRLLAPNKFCFRLKHPKEDRKIGYNYAPDDFCSYGERRSNT